MLEYLTMLPLIVLLDKMMHAALQECHCMLFLTEDNDFAGTDQQISMEEVREGITGMH